MHLLSARIQSIDRILLQFDHPPSGFDPGLVRFSPAVSVYAWDALEHIVLLRTAPLDLRSCYTVMVRGAGVLPVIPDGVFDDLHSEAPLGCTRTNGSLVFRLFAPRASAVEVVLTATLDDEIGTAYALSRAGQGMWEAAVETDDRLRYYFYRVSAAAGCGVSGDASTPIADPWARMVVTRNTYVHEARSVLPPATDAYDWEDDSPPHIDARDLVICEMHVRDMTVHPSSGAPPALAGSYAALALPGIRGGLAHLRALGVNAVELLPCQHFASLEPPYGEPTPHGFLNTWNPYARNHWGYMTSYFFAPEPGYASTAVRAPGEWNDTAGAHAREFRDMVKALHRAGIAVIMDVVYNHASHYDAQPLRAIDKAYWFRLGADGAMLSASGCGNDLHTGRPVSHRLLTESIVHWMQEYHVDGFRFDLAALIDEDAMEEVCEAARAVNPHVILIAEPWGGGRHDIPRLTSLGMCAWNDSFRNGVKGWHPRSAQGYVFGHWGASSSEDFGLWVLGSSEAKGGPVSKSGLAVNYIEAHDGYTFGDFVRIALGRAHEHLPVEDPAGIVHLTSDELRIHRFAALMLFISQGAVMLHAGQEFARAKIIATRDVPDITPGVLDHNSYEKDDETNWLNYEHAQANAALVEWYRGLIRMRASLPQLRRAQSQRYRFLAPDVPIASGFVIAASGDERAVAVLANANRERTATYALPDGVWDVLVDAERAGTEALGSVNGGSVHVPPGTGMVLVAR